MGSNWTIINEKHSRIILTGVRNVLLASLVQEGEGVLDDSVIDVEDLLGNSSDADLY